jgi:hypothetical protein
VRVRVLGGGWYGCHLAVALRESGHDVEVHEIAGTLFAGASGGIPARLHDGWHYPRSKLTRDACRAHRAQFLAAYGHLTHGVALNVYAVAASESLVDFGSYRQVFAGEEFVSVPHPAELGLRHVEGAVLTGERHILSDAARAHFEAKLAGCVRFNVRAGEVDSDEWDWTIDCTFCAHDSAGVDRYEPCITLLLEGPTDRAITIMDGPFPSLYPWDEARGLSSLTSAKFTPIERCATRDDAENRVTGFSRSDVARSLRSSAMLEQMAEYYPDVMRLYSLVDVRLSIRAMPRSAADARLVDVIRVGRRAMRVRAGKIDAIFEAERQIRAALT